MLKPICLGFFVWKVTAFPAELYSTIDNCNVNLTSLIKPKDAFFFGTWQVEEDGVKVSIFLTYLVIDYIVLLNSRGCFTSLSYFITQYVSMTLVDMKNTWSQVFAVKR